MFLATAALCGVAMGPYKGKQTCEPALLRELLDRFQRGDVLLGECGFASYFMLALSPGRGVDVVTRQQQCRRTDFRCGQRLGEKDHVLQWQRPTRPQWMDEENHVCQPLPVIGLRTASALAPLPDAQPWRLRHPLFLLAGQCVTLSDSAIPF